MIKIELEVIPDPEMYTFFEKGTRGRIYYISNRYSKANNKYLISYDLKKNQTYYVISNLYGHAMAKFLPIMGFMYRSEGSVDN